MHVERCTSCKAEKEDLFSATVVEACKSCGAQSFSSPNRIKESRFLCDVCKALLDMTGPTLLLQVEGGSTSWFQIQIHPACVSGLSRVVEEKTREEER